MRARRLICALALAACTYPNGRFDGDGSATSAGASTTAAASEPTTTLPTTATSATTASTSATETMTATATGTTSASASSGESESGSGSTGGVQPTCWGSDAWTIVPIDVDEFVEAPSAFRVNALGTSLIYTGTLLGEARPYASTRASLDQPFAPGTPIATWESFGADIRQAIRAEAGDELLFVADFGGGQRLGQSILRGEWSEPTPIPGLLMTATIEQTPKLTADGARLFFFTELGPFVGPPINGNAQRIWQAARPGGGPGDPFEAANEVALPGITDQPLPHFTNFPTPSPDGLHLFFSTSYPTKVEDAAPAVINEALDTYYSQRASVEDPWGPAVKVEALDAPGSWNSPDSVTADGCQLFFHRWHTGPLTLLVALRTPRP